MALKCFGNSTFKAIEGFYIDANDLIAVQLQRVEEGKVREDPCRNLPQVVVC